MSWHLECVFGWYSQWCYAVVLIITMACCSLTWALLLVGIDVHGRQLYSLPSSLALL
jgi:hypothetical protein